MLDTVDELPPVESGACLVLLHDEREHRRGTRFYLTKSPTLLGRVEGADIVLPYVTLSRRQCRFLLRDGAWWVLDDMSTGGTHVNHQHVHQHRLAEGDVLSFGQVELLFLQGPASGLDVGAGGESAGTVAAPSLRDLWEAEAHAFAAWARAPGHDSYPRFHRDQFLPFLPAPGRRTLDIGCGEGRVSRDLKALGHAVEGVDGSATMVLLAREADRSIPVHHADAAALPFPDGYADLTVLFMSLQDIDDFRGAIREAYRVLEPGGHLVLAIVHPLNSAGRFASEASDSPFVIQGAYLDAFRTADRVGRDGLTMTFHSEHRPLEAYLRALEDAGFLVEALREPRVPDAAAASDRSKRWQRVPLFLHVRAVRPPERVVAG
jgi:SAM-dependent methyltransferase